MIGKVWMRMAGVAIGAGAGAWLGAAAPTGVIAGGAIGACLALAFGWKSSADAGAPAGSSLRRGSVPKILDTSVIIDGRIAEVCDSGFVDGPLVIPRFVLQELQRIADSGDPVKRSRGRRGLDILNRLQHGEKIEVQVIDRDFPAIAEVDEKLVALAKAIGGKVVTNDYNLNKVAEIQNVQILNLNDLASSLKPAAMPGESFSLKILKEGREAQQGIGYLEDGTMVVVENGRKLVGQTAEVTISSVMQTPSGRMMFARPQNGKT